MADFNFFKPGDALLYMELPDGIRLMRGLTALTAARNPVKYSRRYVDELDGTVDAAGFYPSVEFELELLRGDPVHEKLAACFADGAAGGAVFTLYTADTSSGAPLYPCVRREYTFIPNSMRYGSDGAGMPARSLSGAFYARGLPEQGSAELSPDRLTLIFIEE